MGNAFPFGGCECRDGCQCLGVAGPAAYVVRRSGIELRVCTRCDLTSDSDKRMLVTGETLTEAFGRWDALGYLCLAARLAETDV